MSILSNLTTDASIQNDTDSVGNDYSPLESGIYAATVTSAYIKKADSGAMALELTMKTDTDREIRQTLWMTSGTAKGLKNYYTDKSGEKKYLPGFTAANNLTLLTVGQEIGTMDTEVKVVSLYSRDAKAEVPTKVDMLMDLLNKEVLVGLLKQTVDKTAKNESTGIYEATGETRDENEVDKFFRAKDRLTTAEIRAQAEEPSFINTWEAKWTGKTRIKAKVKAGAGTAGVVSSPFGAAANTAKKPATSLFAA